MSPTSRSLDLLRRQGYVAQVVEQNVPHARTKRDLFGFLDIVAIRDGETLGVQTTDITNIAARITKIEESPHLEAVRAAGWRIVIHGWRPDDYEGALSALREVDLTEPPTEEP